MYLGTVHVYLFVHPNQCQSQTLQQGHNLLQSYDWEFRCYEYSQFFCRTFIC